MVMRILKFLSVALIATGLVLFAKSSDLFDTGSQNYASYQVSAKNLQLNCTGPAIVTGGSTGTSVTGFKRAGKTSVGISYSAAKNTYLSLFGRRSIPGYSIRQDIEAKISTPEALTVKDSTGKVAQGSELLTANQLQLVKHKRINGLMASPCLRPQSEFWLVGGSTKVGREALLVLNNPSLVDATVDLEIFTENGASHSAGLTGIAVPKGKTTVLPLSSFVLRAGSLAVHVVSHGGSITALIQQKAVRGIFANGADYIAPSEVLTKDSYFPSILVRGADDTHKLRAAGAKYSDIQNMLRVYVPGEVDAKLTMQILGTTTETFGTVLQITAPAGKVSDFEIKGLADGDYLGILNSNVEVRSSIRLVRASASGDKFADFAWLNAAQPFTTTRYVAVPRSGISKLSLVNSSNKQTTVTLKLGSATITRRISANSAEVIRATPGISIGIIPNGAAIHASLLVDVSGRISVIPILDDKNISGQVEVSVH